MPCDPRAHLTSAVLNGCTVWISTFVQRCVEHDELVTSCAERLEASQPKPGEPCPVPVGTVATYGPGLAPLEYARLTGLVSRYATTESVATDVEGKSETRVDSATLADVHAPWRDNDTAVSPKASPSDNALDGAAKSGSTAQAAPGVPSEAPSEVPSDALPQPLTASRGVVYPRHLPELKVQKLPKCVIQTVPQSSIVVISAPGGKFRSLLIWCNWLLQRAVCGATSHRCLSGFCSAAAGAAWRRRRAVATVEDAAQRATNGRAACPQHRVEKYHHTQSATLQTNFVRIKTKESA